MIRAQIVTWWETTAEDVRPHLTSLLQSGDSLMDVTGQPVAVASPVVVECWLGASTLTTIESHPDYGDAAILFTEAIDEPTN